MSMLDDLKRLPSNIANAIRNAVTTGENVAISGKISSAAVNLVIKTGADDIDYDALSLPELKALLDELESKLFELQSEEPGDEDSDEYEEWEDTIDELEDLIDEVQDAIDEREE